VITMRVLRYAFDEAVRSLWRSRPSGLLSTATIALALFVLGGFLLATTNLERLGAEWSSAAELSVYLKDDISSADRRVIQDALTPSDTIASSEYLSKSDALARFKQTFTDLAGVVDGLGYGHNTLAGLITRGLSEMTRLAVACGGRAETMSGLSGLGDLVLTCTGGLSRNRSLGMELGRGRKLEDIVRDMRGMVAEGVMTTSAAVGLARSVNLEMPILEQMYAVLNDGKDPRDAMHELMHRPLTQESALFRV